MKIKLKQDELQKNRILKGFSQESLAAKADISGGYYSQVENGIRNPSPELAARICKVLDVMFEDIFFISSANANKCKEKSA